MKITDLPPSLQPQTTFMKQYIETGKAQSVFLAAEPGCGRGHTIKVVLSYFGRMPVYLDTPDQPPDEDTDGNRLFPIYDLAKPQVLPWKSFVLVPNTDKVPKSNDPPQVMGFPRPQRVDLIEACEQRKWPVSLATLNSTYADLMNAGRTWEVCHVETGRELDPVMAWADFHAGGEAPFDASLMAYYCAYNLPPKEVDWNRDLWLLRRVRAPIARIVWGRIRKLLPERPRFPAILTVTKPKLKRKDRTPDHNNSVKDSTSEPLAKLPTPAAKTYVMEW